MAAVVKKSMREIKRDIVSFLDATSCRVDPKPGKHSCGLMHRNGLVLATATHGRPRATVLEFFNEGITIYIWGEPGGKIANIRRNPFVSAAIYEQPLNHAQFQRSLQLFGKAELITVRNKPRLFRARAKQWNLMDIGKKIMGPLINVRGLSPREAGELVRKSLHSLSLIKIVPYHMILKEYHPDFSLKRHEWTSSKA